MRRTILGFFILLLPLCPVLGEEHGTRAQDHTRRGMTAYSAGDYPLAIESFKQAFALRPENSAVAYNISCCYALLGEKDSALVWLEKALQLGVYFFADDEDLESLRAEPRYKELETLGAEKIAELGAREWPPVVKTPGQYADGAVCPAVIGLHGFGTGPEDFAAALAPGVTGAGYVLCCPFGPEIRGVTAFGWGNCADAEQRVLETVEYLARNYRIDTTRIVLLGYSQGGARAFCTGLKNGGVFAGLIAVAGHCCPEVGSYLDAEEAQDMAIYMMIGENDRSVDSNRAAARVMEEKGIRFELVVYPDLGHAFPPNADGEIRKALEWMESGTH